MFKGWKWYRVVALVGIMTCFYLMAVAPAHSAGTMLSCHQFEKAAPAVQGNPELVLLIIAFVIFFL